MPEPTLLPDEDRHRLRSELHAIRIGLALMKKELELGLTADALVTYERVVESVDRLAADPSITPPAE